MIDERAWLAERRTGIGGSDVDSVFSEPPYGCARRLWLEKRGVAQDYPEPPSAVMQRGKKLEDLVADLYAEKTGRALKRRDSLVSPDHDWARVNMDREIAPIDDRGPGALEVKTHNFWLFRKVKEEGLAAAHILQLQHALFVTGYRWGSYAVLHPDSWQLVHFDVERDDKLIATIADAGARFWRQVEHGPMPDPLPEIDKRCAGCPWRRQCRGEALLAAAKIPKDDLRARIERDETLAPLLSDYWEAREIFEGAEATLELIKDAIRDRLGKVTAAECEGSRVYFRDQTSMRWDGKALDVAHPELADKFKRPLVTRPLRVYRI